MDEPTPTQKASAELADALFADPALHERFRLMAKETAEREPVRDDFAWLQRKDEYSRFEALTRKLLSVPKSAIDAARGKNR